MHASKETMPVVVQIEGYTARGEEWGDMTVSIENITEPADPAPFFQGLPDDRCQAHHWGYVLKGQMRVKYADHEEVFNQGDAYYIAPGHTPYYTEAAETLEFTRTEELQKTQEVVQRNLQAMMGGQPQD